MAGNHHCFFIHNNWQECCVWVFLSKCLDTNWVSYNPILTLPGVSVRLHRFKGSFLQDWPHFRWQSQVMEPQSNHTSVQLGYKVMGSHNHHPSLQGLIIYWDSSWNSRKYLLRPIYYKKNTGEQTDEEVCSIRSGNVPSTRTSVKLEDTTLLLHGGVPQNHKSTEACSWGIFMEVSSYR